MIKACWRNPCSYVTEDILIGNTTFRIFGLYNDGEGEEPFGGRGNTAPVKPDFEISSISLIVSTPQGDAQMDITKVLEDVNSITWRKDANNDLFEFLSDKMIERCREEI